MINIISVFTFSSSKLYKITLKELTNLEVCRCIRTLLKVPTVILLPVISALGAALESDDLYCGDRKHQADSSTLSFPEFMHGFLNLTVPSKVVMIKHLEY